MLRPYGVKSTPRCSDLNGPTVLVDPVVPRFESVVADSSQLLRAHSLEDCRDPETTADGTVESVELLGFDVARIAEERLVTLLLFGARFIGRLVEEDYQPK